MKEELKAYIKHLQDYRERNYDASLRSGNFEFGFDKGFEEGAIWIVTQMFLRHEKRLYLNDQRYHGACDLLEEVMELVDERQKIFEI